MSAFTSEIDRAMSDAVLDKTDPIVTFLENAQMVPVPKVKTPLTAPLGKRIRAPSQQNSDAESDSEQPKSRPLELAINDLPVTYQANPASILAAFLLSQNTALEEDPQAVAAFVFLAKEFEKLKPHITEHSAATLQTSFRVMLSVMSGAYDFAPFDFCPNVINEMQLKTIQFGSQLLDMLARGKTTITFTDVYVKLSTAYTTVYYKYETDEVSGLPIARSSDIKLAPFQPLMENTVASVTAAIKKKQEKAHAPAPPLTSTALAAMIKSQHFSVKASSPAQAFLNAFGMKVLNSPIGAALPRTTKLPIIPKVPADGVVACIRLLTETFALWTGPFIQGLPRAYYFLATGWYLFNVPAIPTPFAPVCFSTQVDAEGYGTQRSIEQALSLAVKTSRNLLVYQTGPLASNQNETWAKLGTLSDEKPDPFVINATAFVLQVEKPTMAKDLPNYRELTKNDSFIRRNMQHLSFVLVNHLSYAAWLRLRALRALGITYAITVLPTGQLALTFTLMVDLKGNVVPQPSPVFADPNAKDLYDENLKKIYTEEANQFIQAIKGMYFNDPFDFMITTPRSVDIMPYNATFMKLSPSQLDDYIATFAIKTDMEISVPAQPVQQAPVLQDDF